MLDYFHVKVQSSKWIKKENKVIELNKFSLYKIFVLFITHQFILIMVIRKLYIHNVWNSMYKPILFPWRNPFIININSLLILYSFFAKVQCINLKKYIEIHVIRNILLINTKLRRQMTWEGVSKHNERFVYTLLKYKLRGVCRTFKWNKKAELAESFIKGSS